MSVSPGEPAAGPSGLLVVDKEPGPSSFEVVQWVRRCFNTRRVGHGGTLDPFASGVLPVCVGEGTKLAPYLLDADKEYEATVRLGIATDTYDRTGQITSRCDDLRVTDEALQSALAPFRGTFDQLPPAYAAIKVAGRALYDYARKGEEAPRTARAVTIHELSLLSREGPDVRLFVRCSKGTYIRSLAHDLGAALNVGAHLTELRRLRAGPFDLTRAVKSQELRAGGSAGVVLWGLAEVLGHWPTRTLSPAESLAITQGKRVAAELGILAAGTRLRLLREDGSLLAVATAERRPDDPPDAAPGQLKPERVFLVEPPSRGQKP